MKNKRKTHKGLAKRVKVTGSGKLKKFKAKRKQRFTRGSNSPEHNTDQKTQILKKVDEKKIKELLNN